MVSNSKGLYRRITQAVTYSFHPETTTAVHHLKEILVLLAAEPAELRDLEVGPEMAHVIGLAFHGFGVDFGQAGTAGVGTQDLLGERGLVVRVVFARLGCGLLSRLNKHLPEALRGDVIKSLVGGSVAEDVGHGLSELLDSNGEPVRLVAFNHLEEGVTDILVSTRHCREVCQRES